MLYDILQQNIMYLHGVGPRRAQLLREELEVETWGDLLYQFPTRFIDRSRIYRVADLSDDMQYVQLKGYIVSIDNLGKGSSRRIEATFTDGSGQVRLVWFRGLKYIEKSLRRNTLYLLLGKPAIFNGAYNIAHPELDPLASDEDIALFKGLRPIYRTTERMKRAGITSSLMAQLVDTVFAQLQDKAIRETLPDHILMPQRLMSLDRALRLAHHPQTLNDIPYVEQRVKFEELFFVQLDILSYARQRTAKTHGYVFSRVGEMFMRFYRETLPFDLTDAQKRVMHEIRRDLGCGRQMNRLLQGDVGSGKTIVAVMSMLIAIDNGFQACIMAPTEILAEQHHEAISTMLRPLGLRVELLTGIVKGKRRNDIFTGIADGSVHILVGTHALLGDDVRFRNLGLAIIDEQHRFGVEQRARLWAKNTCPPHILVMTATPIPRTLAMTVYGDLDVSIIDQLPPGRKPIETLHYYDNNNAATTRLVRQEVAKGHQVYFVYPLIKESEKSDLKDLEEGYRQICATFPDMRAGMLHGKMKPAEKNDVMQQFVSGQLQLLVSTTVIEVGVNVPNASVMIIANAERFGLAQLHQLRGRVGRGAEQSYCVLVTDYKLSETSRCRIEIMCDTTDGFRIAEEDLKLRGPGDLDGTQQSGVLFKLKMASITRDHILMEIARKAAQDILDADPELTDPANRLLADGLRKYRGTNINWSNIS